MEPQLTYSHHQQNLTVTLSGDFCGYTLRDRKSTRLNSSH